MRDEVRDALRAFVTALEAHADAAAAVGRPDIPDPLPHASRELVGAVRRYRRVLGHWTGAYVPLEVAEPPGADLRPAADHGRGTPGGDEAHPPPHRDGLDWAGDVERWR